ncbi:hypothetical protein EDC01DRAFT_659968 [Geopyxis carbonaria]|nr:hypothetical protein EDC01DRAFT_659968 [Geopyxis carbonaria]
MPLPNTISNPSLYGAPRPKSKGTKVIHLSSTSIHALSAELSHARAAASATSKSAPARTRPSKSTSSLFRPNKGVSARAAKDAAAAGGGATTSADLGGNLDEHELARSRKKMRVKARLYDKLKRGEAEDGDVGLVDFDRKWAERQAAGEGRLSDSDSDADDDDDGAPVQYEDEFGRTRTGSKKEAAAAEKARVAAAQGRERPVPPEEGRPDEPARVIYGNTIQAHAFQTPQFSTVPSSETLAAALPALDEDAEEAHYDASKEVRTKGVGFYAFSKDTAVRRGEMEALERERERTERERAEKEERRKRKREEIEKRKEAVREKRRGKVGEKWLVGFMGEMGGDGEEKTEEKKE